MSNELPPKRTLFIRVWVFSIVLLYSTLGVMAVSVVLEDEQVTHRNHLLRMDPNAREPGKTQPDALPPGDGFTPVHVGIYLDGIETLSIRDSFWTATFYVWFRWKGDESFDPGRSFQVVDGRIEKKELQDSYSAADGTHYRSYKLVGRMTKFFNTTRSPLDDHMLNIYIEDSERDVSKLRYVADTAANRSSRVRVPGYTIDGFQHVVKAHTYLTTHGDPRVKEGQRTTYSEYNFALTIKREGLGVYLKIFLGLFAGVILTLGSFFIRPSDAGPRFAIPSAAYFGTVANTYIVNSMVPTSGQFGLPDFVTSIGLFTISLCVAASLTSGYFYLRKDEKEFSRQLDRASWLSISIGFALLNIVLPFVAFR